MPCLLPLRTPRSPPTTTFHHSQLQFSPSSGDLFLLIREKFNLFHIQKIMPESHCYKQTTELNIQASSAPMEKKEATLASSHGDNDKVEEGATADNMDPPHPLLNLKNPDLEKFLEWRRLESVRRAKNKPKDIIIPDPTPKKIFLDTIGLLAKETNNLVDELWNYIKDKKLVQTAVLLLAAQGQIHGACSSKKYVNGKQNGFHIIMNRMVEHTLSLRNKKGENGNAQEQLEEGITLSETFLLVGMISQAGEDLNKHIQAHHKVPHVEILEHVSSILKDHGFCHTGEGIDVRNLRPYDCKMADKGQAKAVTETAHAAGKKAARKKVARGWDPEYRRRMFFPYWRSVLVARLRVRVYPSYVPMSELDREEVRNSLSDSTDNGSSRNPNHNLGLLGRIQQPTSNYRSRGPFGTAAFTGNGSSATPNPNLGIWGRIWEPTSNHQSRRLFGAAAFTLLKVLKNA